MFCAERGWAWKRGGFHPSYVAKRQLRLSSWAWPTRRSHLSKALNYEWAISDDRQVCHVYERFQDSNAVMNHMERFDANFAAQFGETVKLVRFVVYGTPSPQVKDALAGASPVYMAPFGGFSR